MENLTSLDGMYDIWHVQTVLLIPVRCFNVENHCRVTLLHVCALSYHIHYSIGVLHCTFIVGA